MDEIKILDKKLQNYDLFPDEACCLMDKFTDLIDKESTGPMGKAQREFYSDCDLKGVVPQGRRNRRVSICGVNLKNYTQGHVMARTACGKFRKVVLDLIRKRFPPEKQTI